MRLRRRDYVCEFHGCMIAWRWHWRQQLRRLGSPYLTEEGKLTLDEASTLVKEFSFMMLTLIKEQAPIPPPSYQRAQARLKPTLHLDALMLVRTLHVLALCHLAVRVAHRRCAPPLPVGPGGTPRT